MWFQALDTASRRSAGRRVSRHTSRRIHGFGPGVVRPGPPGSARDRVPLSRRPPELSMSRCVAAAAVCAAVLSVGGCGPGSPPVQPPEPPVVTVDHPVERELDSFTEFTGYLR